MFSELERGILNDVVNNIIKCQREYEEDYSELLKEAKSTEMSETAKKIFDLMFENEKIAREDKIPICQDTGTAVFFVKLGDEFSVRPFRMKELLTEATREAYERGCLRKSIVKDPFKRENTGDNTPPVVHFIPMSGKGCEIIFAAKGGGAENKSRLAMLPPSSTEEDVANFIVETVMNAGPDACPPFVLGIGLGGNFEMAPWLAKKALCRPITSLHESEFYRNLEKNWLKKVNDTHIGPQGRGGNVTAIRLFVETGPCHIASLPVAVNINCHAHRHFNLKYID